MLKTILIIINTIIFLALSGIHVYWVFGGTWGAKHAVPDQWQEAYFDASKNGKIKIATAVVALALFACALLMLSHTGWISVGIFKDWTHILTIAMGAAFGLRAIGDFNIVGFFKKKRDDNFSKSDTQLFSPLCFFISVTIFLMLYL